MEGAVEDAFEDLMLLVRLDDRIAQQHLQFAVLFQGVREKLKVSVHLLHLVFLAGEVEQRLGVSAG